MSLFSNPIVGMIGWSATILSLFLGIYFYIQSTKKRDLVYYVNPAQAVVVKTGETSNLHVSYGDRELKSDVTAAQIAIWNRGNESIRPESVLEPVTIRTSPSVPILEASIRKKSRGVVDITLDQSRLSEGVVGMKWNILEQRDGAVIQIVYAGPPSINIEVSGVFEGQDQIRNLKYLEENVTKPPWPFAFMGSNIRLGQIFLVFGVLLFGIVYSRLLQILWNKLGLQLTHLEYVGVLIAPFVLIVLGCLYIYTNMLHINPPFGF